MHYTDLLCNAMNNPDAAVIFDKMSFDIIESPAPGEFVEDMSGYFLYPHQIDLTLIDGFQK